MRYDLRPMLATLVEGPFDDKEWVFEVKWDGYRIMAVKDTAVTLYTRNLLEATKRYPALAEAVRKIKRRVVIDGELVAVDARGRPQFELMQNAGPTTALLYYAFDLLYLNGKDLRDQPLLERKKLLRSILPKSGMIRYSDHVQEKGERFFKAAVKQKLEGVVAKRAASTYYSGKRTRDWLKIKCAMRQEVVIVGYTAPRNSRKYIGSLVLAVHSKEGFRYVGHTGGGLSMGLKDMYDLLQPLRADKRPIVDTKIPEERNVTWVRPTLVGEVKFTEWTAGGQMRHPIFVGLRTDKKPKQVLKEKSHAAEKSSTPAGLVLSNLDKVFWPKEGYTKGDVVRFYERMAPYILPHLAGRPESLNRQPNGVQGKNFFQKDFDHKQVPPFVRTADIYSESNEKDLHWVLCDNKESLLWLANLGCIELNPWQSRVKTLDRPDYITIDLDPNGRPFKEVVQVALAVKKILDIADVECFVKTSGKTGLHVVVPLAAKYTYAQARDFAALIVAMVHTAVPELTTLEWYKNKRQKKIFLDIARNARGQTTASVYCVRPYPGATVSTPLKWSEVKPGLDPGKFTIKTIFKRLEKVGDLWKPVLTSQGVTLADAIKRLQKHLKGQ
jgi:bifunctional non-homologous end joining protein LigD